MPLTYLSLGHTEVSDLSPLAGMPLEELVSGGTSISDVSPLQGMDIKVLLVYSTSISDLSPLKGMPLRQMWASIRLFDPGEEELVRSLPMETLNGLWPDGQPADEFWKEFEAKRQAAVKFAEDTSKLPVEKQSAVVLAKLRELNNIDLKLACEIEDEVVSSAKVTFGEGGRDVSPLRAFAQMKELTLVGGHNSLDLSPIRIAPLEKLTCSRLIVLRNLPILRDMPTLKTINGEPSEEYLAGLEQPAELKTDETSEPATTESHTESDDN